MTIHELKKELDLSNKDIAEFFGLTPAAYANSSAKTRYEFALCSFYEFLKREEEKNNKITPSEID
jgi:predicted transcriptional regulator